MSSLAIVGPGRMGLALGKALQDSGSFAEIVVFGRRPEPPSHPLFHATETRYVFGLEPLPTQCVAVLLAVSDDAVPEAAHLVAAQGPAPEGCAAFHLSGALPTDVLAPLHAAGYGVGAFHPWVLVSRWAGSWERLRGAAVGVTASHEALRTARTLASLFGGTVVPVPATRRVLADAAVAIVAAYLPVVLERGSFLLEDAGVNAEDAMAVLLPLARSVLEEVDRSGGASTIAQVLARTDPDALGVHLRSLEGDDRQLYAWLEREATRLGDLEISEARSLPPADLEPVPGDGSP
jgi:predicted short-subunit dehydrogenase-like oxidoreductase (DUF2520 family)